MLTTTLSVSRSPLSPYYRSHPSRDVETLIEHHNVREKSINSASVPRQNTEPIDKQRSGTRKQQNATTLTPLIKCAPEIIKQTIDHLAAHAESGRAPEYVISTSRVAISLNAHGVSLTKKQTVSVDAHPIAVQGRRANSADYDWREARRQRPSPRSSP